MALRSPSLSFITARGTHHPRKASNLGAGAFYPFKNTDSGEQEEWPEVRHQSGAQANTTGSPGTSSWARTERLFALHILRSDE